MIHTVKTYTNIGLQGHEIVVEVDANNGLPGIEIIGLPDAAIKESKERMRATFRNAGIAMPNKKFVLNLAPSDLKKVGTSFDLPMAVALLKLIYDIKKAKLDDFLFFGELGLDGSIKRVNGLLPSVISALKRGYTNFVVPADNVYELEYIPDISIYPIQNFSQLTSFIISGQDIWCITEAKDITTLSKESNEFQMDFEHIKGHIFAKRALAIAAAGGHNVLLVGAPGSGKTMLSKALQSILPPLNFKEILEVSQIYSVVGKLNKENPLIIQRPFRQVHHTASKISIVGGSQNLVPGEVSLAHKGILFFDELTEFPREVLEVLRQPIEDKSISISRVSGTVEYPANFMFVASMNPCKCGYYKDPQKHCICGINAIKKYQSKISGPLMDRIDMILEIPRENIGKLLNKIPAESSTSIKKNVIRARKLQQQRFIGSGIFNNSNMESKDIQKYINLTTDTKDFLKKASQKLILSPRIIHRTIKLGRTIADMEGTPDLQVKHLAEAMQYRSKTMFVNEN